MRRPLAWLILLEVLLVAALAAATYRVVVTRGNPPPTASARAAPNSPTTPSSHPNPKATATPTPANTNTAVATQPTGPTAGLSFDPAFWSAELTRVNADQATLARLQARAANAVSSWVRAYVRDVLLPAVREAEKK